MNVSQKKPEVVCIFKKRKKAVYYEECDDWYLEDIRALTGIDEMARNSLN